MRCLFGFLCVCALGVMGCSETVGSGVWRDWFWDSYDCPGCQCEGDYYEAFTTTLDCFCCRYHCDPESGPFGSLIGDADWGLKIESQTIIEYDCDRRYIRNFQENPQIEFLIDTATNEVVAARYWDDCCVCDVDGMALSAGDWGLDGCEVVSERTCSGPCDVGPFEVKP